MLQLFVENPDGLTPNAAVRWCLSRDVSTCVKEWRKIFLFVSVTRDDGTEVRRFLFPIEQLLGWVQFNRAGRHTLHAAVIGIGSDRIEEHERFERRVFRKASRTSWENEVFGEETKSFIPERLFETFLGYGREVLDKTELDIVVADGLFAKERPTWLRNYVESFFDQPSFDECQFRHRVIAAFSVLPLCYAVVYGISALIKVVQASVLFFWGERGIKWRAVLDVEAMPGEVWSRRNRSNLFAERADGRPRSKWFRLFHPVSVLAFSGLLFFVNHFGVWKETAVAGGGGAGIVLLVMVAAAIIQSLSPKFREKLTRRTLERKQKRIAAAAARRTRREAEAEAVYEALTYAGVPVRPAVNELPKKRRTLYLRVLAHKAEVCRPYAK